MRPSLLLLLLAACGQAPDAPSAAAPEPEAPDATRPPPTWVALDGARHVMAGSPYTMTVSGATAEETVWLAAAAEPGDGPCRRFLGGYCLDLEPPTYLLGTGVTDGDGEVVFDLDAPRWPGARYCHQAVIRRGPGGLATALSDVVCVDFCSRVDDDGDGLCDEHDPCIGADEEDDDSDGICNDADTCPGGRDDLDSDGDGVCDLLDACEGFPDDVDEDGDGVPDACAGGCHCGLVGAPDPSAVFDGGELTHFFPNNLVGAFWVAETDTVYSAYYERTGYYRFDAIGGGYPAYPSENVGVQYGRMVFAPRTGVVVRNNDRYNAVLATNHSVGMLDPDTGDLVGFGPAVFSDGYSGLCNLMSASASEFLCYDGSSVRHYETTPDSSVLTLNRVVSLSGALPSNGCVGACYGGQFAWDGLYYYFSDNGSDSGNTTYLAYDAAGAFVGTWDASGGNAISSTYFDWSTCRYTTHDGWGNRSVGTNYTWAGGSFDNDSQSWSAPSAAHDNTCF